MTSASSILPSTTPDTTSRIQSIDTLRGLVMVWMALDHVREFWSATPYRAEDITQTSVILFFTRWITHFCAPTFVFLSGISIYLYAQKSQNLRKTSLFLVKRGFWLVALELVVINFLWQFNIQLILIQVIWAIGWSMICMAGFIWLPRWLLAILALGVIAGHNLLPTIQTVTAANIGWAILHNTPFVIQVGDFPPILVAYTIAPWFGVMAAGYLIGPWFRYSTEQRTRWLQLSGGILLVLFLFLRFLNGYGDPSSWSIQPKGLTYTALSFLNVSKYPPSLLYVCLTLGVALLLLASVESSKNQVTTWLRTFGQVPFFFYLLHIPLISLSAFLWSWLAFSQVINFSFTQASTWPSAYQPNLLRAYLAWIIVILILYIPCRWFARYRQRHNDWWLSYL